MPVPSFTIDGVLPPFVGPDGPGGAPTDMSPYEVSPLEVVATLGTTPVRRTILSGWLRHREVMRDLEVVRGFQWLDGSFVEDKIPRDLDIVTFFHRPAVAQSSALLAAFLASHPAVFRRAPVKAAYQLDAFFIDLNSNAEQIVSYSRYLLGLFSHRRGDSLWKGMLQVRLEDFAGDADAIAEIDRLNALEATEADAA